MGHIDWILIADMPDALKDGREVLFAFQYANGTVNPGPPHRLYSTGRFYDGRLFMDGDGHANAITPGEPTHFAEITQPR
jgi:hypothetical protein